MSGQFTGIHGFLDDIARWRRAVGSRAPSYHRLLQEFVALLEGNTPEGVNLADRFQEAWASRTFRIFYERPLLLLAALRMDALVEGTAHPLWSALAAPEPDSENVTRGALLDALARDSVWRWWTTRTRGDVGAFSSRKSAHSVRNRCDRGTASRRSREGTICRQACCSPGAN